MGLVVWGANYELLQKKKKPLNYDAGEREDIKLSGGI